MRTVAKNVSSIADCIGNDPSMLMKPFVTAAFFVMRFFCMSNCDLKIIISDLI